MAALPAIAAAVAAFATRGLLDATIAAAQGALVPRVEQRAHDLLHEVVLPDEPAAALDARAEHTVFRTLRGLTAPGRDSDDGRITVLVTHRLANVRHADQILVLERGRLVEHGRHAELMARGGIYHELFSLQARAYSDGGGAPDTVPA